MSIPSVRRFVLIPGMFLGAGPLAPVAEAVDFRHDIYPILEANCLKCHGPDEAEADFRIDRRRTLREGGGSGIPTVVPGDLVESYLIEVLREEDAEYRMPQEADPLPEAQIALIESWIEQGGEMPEDFGAGEMDLTTDLWSMQPVDRPAVPSAPGDASAIDAFLMARLQDHGLRYSGRADPAALIKRAAILLTGLHPGPERIREFVAASARDADAAYAQLLDELLGSAHFGERWAQHWLDVIRWAETNGSEANLYRKNAWMYRDYVVDAFNSDKPYDQFLREQLAGDQLGAGVATGFLVAGPHVPAATVGREPSAIRQARADRLDEIAQSIGASMLGMTVSCARCHNHKFDPISIKDYYAMTAVFEGIEFGSRYPETTTDDPRRPRDRELRAQLATVRALLADEAGVWQEDWHGWNEIHFAPREATRLRITFPTKGVRVDELFVYGPQDPHRNVAAAKHGTVATTPEDIFNYLGPASNINDGETGTMNWRPRKDLAAGLRPSVTLEFPEPIVVDRFSISTNRQYFLETAYLSSYEPDSPMQYTLEAMNGEEEWEEIIDTAAWAEQVEQNATLTAQRERLQAAVDQLLEQGPQPSFVGRFIDPAVAHILHRGSPENPKGEVAPAGLAILDGDLDMASDTPDSERRLKFAEWLTQPDHPLTARVMVNRVWHHIFGAGIVPTAGDFGFAGALPSHPRLLDWLAAELVTPQVAGAAPWSIKALIRQIMSTQAFQQSSAPHEAGLARDATATLLWRFPPRRVEAEVIRDSILLASGRLDPTIGGKSYRIHNEKKTYAQWQVVDNHGEQTWRRLLYQERMRRVDDQIFTAFDFPDCGQVRAKRPVSTTPLQALNLLNSPFAVEQATFIAHRATFRHPDDLTAATARLFELILGRRPAPDELAAGVQVAAVSGLPAVSRSLINTNEFAFLP